MFGIGYHEVLAVVDAQQQLPSLPSLESLLEMTAAQQLGVVEQAIDSLDAYDYLSLQLYQNDDAGN